MREEYSIGIIAYRVRRGHWRKMDEIEGIHRIELPVLPIPTIERQSMLLRMYFLSALDASEAMKNADFQTIRIRGAEEYWNISDPGIGIRAVEHILRVNPRRLIPGSVSGGYGAATYRVPVDHEQKTQSPIKQPDYRTEVEPLSFEQTAHSSYPVCEYDVSYYAAYCDKEKLWEVCPQKRIYTIGGTRYPFPGSE